MIVPRVTVARSPWTSQTITIPTFRDGVWLKYNYIHRGVHINHYLSVRVNGMSYYGLHNESLVFTHHNLFDILMLPSTPLTSHDSDNSCRLRTTCSGRCVSSCR